MAQTPEAKVKNSVKKVLDAEGVYHFSPVGSAFGRSGIPDIICCVQGSFLAIECKAGNNTTTELQKRELRKIQSAGGMAIVINETNVDAVAKTIKMIKEHYK